MSVKLTQEEVISRMKELEPEYDFSKFVYTNSRTKSTVICNKGHEYNVAYNTFQQGHKCPHCKTINIANRTRNNPLSILKYLKEIESEYNFDNFEYINSKTKFKIICNKGHEFYSNWNRFRTGHRCPHCSNNKSKPETEIIEFIKTFYNGTIEQSNRNIVPSRYKGRYMELDIYLPELNFTIEFNGRYYHTDEKIKERGWNSSKEYHDYKYNECFKRNIFLLHIDEVEWIKDKNSILNRIKRLIEISRRL